MPVDERSMRKKVARVTVLDQERGDCADRGMQAGSSWL